MMKKVINILMVAGFICLSSMSFAQTADTVGSTIPVTQGTLPDPSMSPGDIATSSWNDICNTHLSRNRNVPPEEKASVYSEYGITSADRKWCDRIAVSGKNKGKLAGCEVDHIIPLENGGSNDIKNLWPQPYGGDLNAHMKDKLENRVHELICAKEIDDKTVYAIQRRLADDWVTFYKEQFKD